MSAHKPSASLDWSAIEFIVFDVDGTLYSQRTMRLRMIWDIALQTLRERDFRTITVLHEYRRIRERLGDEEADNFQERLVAETSGATNTTPERVNAIATEWLEKRPLAHIRACRCAGIADLFAAIRRNGKAIGVLSDYPAKAKLEAMRLEADYVVTACDTAIGRLKPHPRGLEALMAVAGARAAATIVVGDRVDRDGEVARRAGVRSLIRAARPIGGWHTFAHYRDPVFKPLLAS